MNTYFITGGAGFIGSTLSEKLLELWKMKKANVEYYSIGR